MAIQNVTDAYVLAQTAGDTYNGDSSDQTYSINPNLVGAGDTITIIDQGGDNSIELPAGLEITSSQTISDQTILTLSNGAVVDIRGADTFTFNVGQNQAAGDTAGTDLTFEDFATNVLGVTVPADGDPVVDGGSSTVNDDGTADVDEPADPGDPTPTDGFALVEDDLDPVLGQHNGGAQAAFSGLSVESEDYEGLVTVTVSVTNGVLAAGGAFDNESASEMTFEGSFADLNADLQLITYDNASNSANVDTVTVTVTDKDGAVQTFTQEISVGEQVSGAALAADAVSGVLTGTVEADAFDGTQAEVIAVDTIDGSDGYDVLSVTGVTGAGTLTDDVETTSVERVDLALVGAATVDASQFDGVELITIADDDATLTELDGATTVLMESNDNVNLALAAAQAAGDSFNMILDSGTAYASTITDSEAGNAEEISDLTLDVLQDTGAVTLTAAGVTSITVTGEGDLDLDDLSALTDVAVDAADHEGDLALDLTGTGDVDITGGSGTNTFEFVGTLDNDDTIVGGALNEDETNAETLSADVTGTTNAFDITGVENLEFELQDTADATIDGSGITGATDIELSASAQANADTFTLENFESSATFDLAGAFNAGDTIAFDGVRDGTELNLLLSGASFAGIVTTDGAATLNVETAGAAETLAALTTTGADSLVVTGDADLTVTADLASAINTIDLTEYEAELTATVRGGSTITVGDSADMDVTLQEGLGEAADTFEFIYDGAEGEANFGNITDVTGFDVEEDVFDFSDFGITADDISFLDAGTDTVMTVDTGDNTFTVDLTGVVEADFGNDNFVF